MGEPLVEMYNGMLWLIYTSIEIPRMLKKKNKLLLRLKLQVEMHLHTLMIMLLAYPVALQKIGELKLMHSIHHPCLLKVGVLPLTGQHQLITGVVLKKKIGVED